MRSPSLPAFRCGHFYLHLDCAKRIARDLSDAVPVSSASYFLGPWDQAYARMHSLVHRNVIVSTTAKKLTAMLSIVRCTCERPPKIPLSNVNAQHAAYLPLICDKRRNLVLQLMYDTLHILKVHVQSLHRCRPLAHKLRSTRHCSAHNSGSMAEELVTVSSAGTDSAERGRV